MIMRAKMLNKLRNLEQMHVNYLTIPPNLLKDRAASSEIKFPHPGGQVTLVVLNGLSKSYVIILSCLSMFAFFFYKMQSNFA